MTPVMIENEKDKFYWLARLATADLNIPDEECRKYADILEQVATETGCLSAGEFWERVMKSYAEKLEDDGEWWKDEP